MFRAKEEPLRWLAESAAYFTLLSALQMMAGYATLALIRYNIPAKSKPPLILSLIAAFAILYRAIVDYRTHVLLAMLGGLSLSFTVPLNAVAQLSLAQRGRARPATLETLLRISFPVAMPSGKRPAEAPLKQLVRGGLYLSAAVLMTAPWFLSARTAADGRDLGTGLGGILVAQEVNVAAAAVLFTVAPAVLNLCAAFAGLLGAPSPSPFRRPLTSPSLAAFWAGRWNAPVSDALRAGVYEPLRAAGAPAGAGVLGCFAVSGLAHEAVMVYARAYGSRGAWMAFFVGHGALVIAERGARDWLPRPGWRRWLVVAPVVYATFAALFVPPARWTGLDRTGVEAFGELAHVAKALASATVGVLQLSKKEL